MGIDNSDANAWKLAGGTSGDPSGGTTIIRAVEGAVGITGTLSVSGALTNGSSAAPDFGGDGTKAVMSDGSFNTDVFLTATTLGDEIDKEYVDALNIDADTLDTFNTATAATVNTVAVRDSSADLTANEFRGGGQHLTGITVDTLNGVGAANYARTDVAEIFNANVTISTANLTVTGGNISTNGSITTGSPSGGTFKPWKLGRLITLTPVSIEAEKYLQAEVDGVSLKIALVS